MSTNNEVEREHVAGKSAAEDTKPPAEESHADRAAPRGPRLRVVLVVIAAVLLALLAGVKWSDNLRALYAKVVARHTPEPSAARPGEAGIQYYTCGMHPWVILPHPGDCPICQMQLVPLDPSKFTGEIAIDPVVVQNIGVRVAPVKIGELTQTIRTVGSVAYNETLVRDVNLKIGGWVEKLYVDFVGKPVQKGQPLLDIYSPQLYSAQEEYLQAYRHAQAPAAMPAGQDVPDVTKWNADLLEATRKRLEYFDISAAQIRELETTGKVSKTLTLRSPYSGLVIQKMAYEGMKVDAGMQLFRIADLSSVWVMVTLYEYQLPSVELGQQAVMSLTYLPGQTFAGRVAYIYPYLNEKLRQVSVRLEFDNPNLALKPGMFASVELYRKLAGDRILVPREAVIDTGERQVAFVSLGGGKFEPRNVTLGASAEGGRVEVLGGLKAGEMVVTSGEFLLDSEARLREALAKMIRGNAASEQTPEAAPPASSTQAQPAAAVHPAISAAAQREVDRLVGAYLQAQELLASDKAAGVGGQCAIVAEAAKSLAAEASLKTVAARVAAAAGRKAVSIEDLRRNDEDLSDAVIAMVKLAPSSAKVAPALYQVHCPMAKADWLQTTQNIANPYMGSSMPTCGSVVATFRAAQAGGK